MKLLLDQNVETRIATFLTGRGHEVTRIGRDHAAGLADEEVLAIAKREGRLLVTNDTDFGELIFQRHLSHAGGILLRFPADATAQSNGAALEQAFATHRDHLAGFLVVTPRGVRVR